jgi:hypothetical protein
MKDGQLHVKFEGDESQQKVLIIREGPALPLKEPKQIKIDGLIIAPGKYWTDKKGLHDEKKSHVLVNRRQSTITLYLDETNPYYTTVSGKLTMNPEFTKFEINNEKKLYSTYELVRLFKMNKFLFSDSNVAASVITKLSNLKYKVTTEIERNNDFKGTKTDHIRSILTGKPGEKVIPDNFELHINIFEGEPKQKFMVEIEIDVQDSELVCWLVSPGALELINDTKNTVIDRELAFLKDLCCVEV